MLVSKEPVTVPIPHEPGESVQLVRLSWKQLKKARRRASVESAEMAQAYGAQFLEQLTSQGTNAAELAAEVLKRQEYDVAAFDTETLLRHGLVAWSYKDEAGAPVPVNDETIALLDEATAVWIQQKIINLTKPPGEDELKN